MSLGGSARKNPRGAEFKYLGVGGTTVFDNIRVVSASVDPGSIATVSTGAVTVTVSGVAAGDAVVANPPALNDDLVFSGAAVTDTDEVTLYIYNPTGGAIDDTEKTWTLVLFQVA